MLMYERKLVMFTFEPYFARIDESSAFSRC